MSKASVLIAEAMHRHPEDHRQQVAFIAKAMKRIVTHQLGQYPTLSEDDVLIMIIDLLEALQIPDGPLRIPGKIPLFDTEGELNQHLEEVMREFKKTPQA